jgi:hypothetical protein
VPDHRTARERWLVILLRIAGGGMLLAFLAMLLPTDWMASTHRALGLGEFPRTAIVDYLTRSVSALYGFHGGLLLVLSADPRKHRTVISYIAVMNVVLGMMFFAIDLHARMPWFWTLGEGPPMLIFGIVIGTLNRSADRP